MSKKEKAIVWLENLAKNDSHGYDQIYRWGERKDYDCSSAVITAYQNAGVPVKTNGATYTGNMFNAFVKSGFKDVTNKVNIRTGAGLERGDVLLNIKHHTAMYCGNGLEVEASINEKGTATGGKSGDQTGREILIRSYRNYPWDKVLRLPENKWMKDKIGWWYKYADGTYPKNKWVELDAWYYFNENGYAVTGWKFINGRWYLFGSDCRMKTGWQWVDGKCYYLDKSGAMVKNTYIQSQSTKNFYHWVGSDGAWIPKDDSWDVKQYNYIDV